ncbi:hypothetical protein [Evansella tamaricis]|uniref:Lipoprotein n=1 Tax=Evansella tamaricis TaxID=2069301 RepID=A0ABS6JJJ6_9BACI|nr:hypothetical protein [Evansella tamaricis]MBU9713565.1 hypothetical protein [Evansella tamaricis]
MRWKSFIMILFLVVLLVGCNSTEGDKALIISSDVIESVKTVPDDFYEQSDERVMVKKVNNQDEFNTTWNEFGLQDNPKEIDWTSKVTFFLGLTESGSCPFQFKAVELNADKTTMIVHLDEQSKRGDCTDDLTPRTIIVEVDQDEVSEVVYVEIFGVENHYGKTPKVELIAE